MLGVPSSRFDKDVSDNSSGFLSNSPLVGMQGALPCERIQCHRDERGRAPGLLPAGPSACPEVPDSACLAGVDCHSAGFEAW